jgi:hypothetical protein
MSILPLLTSTATLSAAACVRASRSVWKGFTAHRLLAVGVCLLATSELGLRVLYSDKLRLRSYPGVYETKNDQAYGYRANAKGRLCVPSICKTFSVNHLGYLGPAYPPGRTSGTVRIVVLDSSNGTGIWLAEGQPYPRHLERALQDHGLAAEVLNFSVDGQFRSLDNARYALKVAAEYQPNLMLLRTSLPLLTLDARREEYRGYVIAYSSKTDEARARANVDSLERKWLLRGAYYASYTVRGFARWYMHHSHSESAASVEAFVERFWYEPTFPVALSGPRTASLFEDIESTLTPMGGELVLLGSDADTWLAAFAEHNGFRVWTLEIPDGEPWRHTDDAHWSEAAHKRVAATLADKVLRHLASERAGSLVPVTSSKNDRTLSNAHEIESNPRPLRIPD